ncbi:hypothetical protein [Parerythrobacter aestuarii]|uniref:hypothetical protein n=1 Tax=Parerythrobacter aestuarii TaxID=3020909 RepID=UPI0024DE810B|nr:hypothetical protein [Parerythrobacter aestuarii]
MTALSKFSPGAHKKLGLSHISDVFPTNLFYVIRGRNAWHSTWVTHYFAECMHDSIRTAKDRAEKWREQGSVFTIREQPALAFRSKQGLVLITEINTQLPLGRWIKDYQKEDSEFGLNQDYCRLERFFSKGRTIGSFVKALKDKSVFPDHLPALSKNVFVLVGPDPNALDKSRNPRLKLWKSMSSGANYYLGWREHGSDISGKAVRRIANALADRVSEQKSQA